MTVLYVRYKTEDSFSNTLNTRSEINKMNADFLASYSLSALRSVVALRALELEGPDAARAALWGESKRIYWDHIRGTSRCDSDKRFGAFFAQFVNETPSLKALAEKDSRAENKCNVPYDDHRRSRTRHRTE